jgi:hypothetical protein
MNESTQRDFVLATTETDRGKRDYRSKNMTACFGGVLSLALGMCVALMPGEKWVRAFLVTMMGLSGITCVAAPTFQRRQRGDWRLDHEGILFTPLRGERRYLSWHDIQAIGWQTNTVLLRAGTMTMPLVLLQESREHRDEVRHFLREVSCRSFDLDDLPATPFSIRRVLWGTLVALPFALLPLAGMFVQTTYLDPEHRWGYWGLMWLLGWLVPMMLASHVVRRQQTLRLWRPRQSR